MSELLIGAVTPRAPGPRYFEALRFAEIAPRKPLPRPSVLGKWRDRAPENARLSLLAPPETWSSESGAFRDAGARGEGARWISGAASALRADAVVISTLGEITPGPRDRERARAFLSPLREQLRAPLVWVPGGLWDLEEAAELARSMGVVCGFDPLEGSAPAGDIAYARVRAIGARSRLSEGLLLTIADQLARAEASTVYVALDAEDGARKARRLAELVSLGAGGLTIPSRGVVIEGALDEEDLDDDDDEDEDEDADDEDADDEDDEDADDEDDELGLDDDDEAEDEEDDDEDPGGAEDLARSSDRSRRR